MTEILACGVPDSSLELSTGQFAKFFQIFSLPNATRILRQIYNSPNNTKTYKDYQVKVSCSNGQYLATVIPKNSSDNLSPSCGNTFGLATAANDFSAVFSDPFCDWLTIHQDFDFSLPELNSGCVVSLNSIPERSDGHFDFESNDIEFMTTKFISHKGSYETNLQLRVDRGKLTLSGNIGRFGRPDNLFGFSLLDCIKKANRVIDSLDIGLSHFSSGDFSPSVSRNFLDRNGIEQFFPDKWSGAYFTQVHLTKNLLFSSADEATLFMEHACRLNPWGMTVHPHFGQGVHYGKGSQYVNPKLYLKGLEILESKKYKHIDEEYRNKLLKYIANRIVRFEINYKSKFLKKNAVSFLGDVMNEEKRKVLYVDFRNRLNQLVNNEIDFYEGLESLTRRQKEQFFSWTRGTNIRESYSKRTYFRLKELFWNRLHVDISVPYSEQHSVIKVRNLACSEITNIPSFYQFSDLDSGLKLVA